MMMVVMTITIIDNADDSDADDNEVKPYKVTFADTMSVVIGEHNLTLKSLLTQLYIVQYNVNAI